jgi:multiple antibiotic resistance protein
MLFAQVFVTILVIMDPVGNVPVFLALTKGETGPDRRTAARQATAAAAAVILAFAAFGQQLLHLLGISLEALQVSGGLLLVLVALELLQGGSGAGTAVEDGMVGMNVALVPLGTPLLAGPGAIAATMVYIREAESVAEVAIVVGALVTALAVVYLALRLAEPIATRLGTNGIVLLSRVVGLLVAAIAVQLVATGIDEWVRGGV